MVQNVAISVELLEIVYIQNSVLAFIIHHVIFNVCALLLIENEIKNNNIKLNYIKLYYIKFNKIK